MKKNKIKTEVIILFLAGLVMLGSIKIWAPICKSTTMACFGTSKTLVILAILTLALAIQELFINTNKSYIIMLALGILVLAITYKNGLSTGFCPNPIMRCNKTDWWIKGSGLLIIVAGIMALTNSTKREKHQK